VVSLFESIREQIDLVAVADRHLDLAPSGSAMKGRCPYSDHDDENPSFYAYPDGRFHCYGCGRHGDVVDLWATLKGLRPGIEAACDLAQEYGISLPEADLEATDKADERRRREAEYLEDAQKFHQALTRAQEVAEWWEQRGFDEDLRQRFLLGAHEGAAVIPFWTRGRVEGFIRRNLQGEPKYRLQRAEEFVRGYRPLFIPGALNGEMFLVEGYVDALALAALGSSAIAIGGTHISDRQMEELMRIPGRLYILPDDDGPGEEAARRWVEDLYPKAALCPANYEKERTE
jgi:DNA primase